MARQCSVTVFQWTNGRSFIVNRTFGPLSLVFRLSSTAFRFSDPSGFLSFNLHPPVARACLESSRFENIISFSSADIFYQYLESWKIKTRQFLQICKVFSFFSDREPGKKTHVQVFRYIWTLTELSFGLPKLIGDYVLRQVPYTFTSVVSR